jgi:Flp pilus assembly protein TadD|tara:strand:+ start:218 stop:679 length:462 start_codon:yes stop_codon:yes gene_type:complete
MKFFRIFSFLIILILSSAIYSAKYDKKVDSSKLYEEATTFLKKEEYRKALRVLNKYTKAKPKDSDGWTLYAFAQRKLKNFRKAEANYEKALKLDPENKIALEYQGELFVETDRSGLAQVNLNKLKELCPTSCDELEQLKLYINKEAEKTFDNS